MKGKEFVGKDVSPLRYWVHAILPLVYDDSLSYYEVLAKVSQKMNEVIEGLNANNEQVEWVTEYTIQEIKNLTESFNNFSDSMLTRQENFENNITDKENKFEQSMQTQQRTFEAKIEKAQSDFESKISQQEAEFENTIGERQQGFETEIRQRATQFEESITNKQTEFEGSITGEFNTFKNEVNTKFQQLSTQLEGDIAEWEADTQEQLNNDYERVKGELESDYQEKYELLKQQIDAFIAKYTVVQDVGDSTEHVPSQDAWTKLGFFDRAYKGELPSKLSDVDYKGYCYYEIDVKGSYPSDFPDYVNRAIRASSNLTENIWFANQVSNDESVQTIIFKTQLDDSPLKVFMRKLSGGSVVVSKYGDNYGWIELDYTFDKGITTTDYNKITETGMYYCSSSLNAPPDYLVSYLLVLNTGNGIITQVAFNSNGETIYYRFGDSNESWYSWHKLITIYDIVQTTGNNTTKVMSQDAVTRLALTSNVFIDESNVNEYLHVNEYKHNAIYCIKNDIFQKIQGLPGGISVVSGHAAVIIDVCNSDGGYGTQIYTNEGEYAFFRNYFNISGRTAWTDWKRLLTNNALTNGIGESMTRVPTQKAWTDNSFVKRASPNISEAKIKDLTEMGTYSYMWDGETKPNDFPTALTGSSYTVLLTVLVNDTLNQVYQIINANEANGTIRTFQRCILNTVVQTSSITDENGWQEIGGAGGGSGVTVVQDIGSSTTSVPSQKAWSDLGYMQRGGTGEQRYPAKFSDVEDRGYIQYWIGDTPSDLPDAIISTSNLYTWLSNEYIGNENGWNKLQRLVIRKGYDGRTERVRIFYRYIINSNPMIGRNTDTKGWVEIPTEIETYNHPLTFNGLMSTTEDLTNRYRKAGYLYVKNNTILTPPFTDGDQEGWLLTLASGSGNIEGLPTFDILFTEHGIYMHKGEDNFWTKISA